MICQVIGCPLDSSEEWNIHLSDVEIAINFHVCIAHMREFRGSGILGEAGFKEQS